MTHDHRTTAGDIGDRIRRARIAAEVTQAQLAKAASLSRPSIANAETGAQNLTVSALLAISARLGVTVGALIGEQPLNLPPRVRVSAGGWVVRCDECGLIDTCATKALADDARVEHLDGAHNVPALAQGGIVTPGTWAIVGESGAEDLSDHRAVGAEPEDVTNG